MPFDKTIDSRNWRSVATLAFVSILLAVSVLVAHAKNPNDSVLQAIARFPASWPFILLFGYGCWCVAINRKWRIQVVNGEIVWDPVFFGRKNKLSIKDIRTINVNLDEAYDFYFQLDGGRRKQIRALSTPLAQEDFFAAIVEENPDILILHQHMGST
jgi:hypothetical protein